MRYKIQTPTRQLLVQVCRRLPAGQRFVQEAFTTEHRRPVMVKITDLQPGVFYAFDEISARAFSESVTELAAQHGGSRLTISLPLPGEFQGQRHRLQRLSAKLETIRALVAGDARDEISGLSSNIELIPIRDAPLVHYRIALCEGPQPGLFICREPSRPHISAAARRPGFFTFDPETVAEVADDVDLAARGMTIRLAAYDKLFRLHQTTQQIERELASYGRRINAAVRQARRRPDLLTPARFDRIVNHAVAKMEELRMISLRALRSLEKQRR
jgi:hypothetical protein